MFFCFWAGCDPKLKHNRLPLQCYPAPRMAAGCCMGSALASYGMAS